MSKCLSKVAEKKIEEEYLERINNSSKVIGKLKMLMKNTLSSLCSTTPHLSPAFTHLTVQAF